MRKVPAAEVAPSFSLAPGELNNLAAELPGLKVPLCTKGQLRIFFLGVGSAFATRNYQTNIVIVKGRSALSIDLGTLATQRLRQLGISPLEIEHLVVTHSHADHIGGVEELALKWRYLKCAQQMQQPGTLRPRLYGPLGYLEQLWQRSLRGGLGNSEANRGEASLHLCDYFELCGLTEESGWGRPAYRLVLAPGSPDELSVLLFRTRHLPDDTDAWDRSFVSFGLRIGERVLYTGDTRFDLDMLERFGAGVETIFHDCQSFQGGVHASFAELATLPAAVRARMLLMHLDDGMLALDPRAAGFQGFAADAMAHVYDFD